MQYPIRLIPWSLNIGEICIVSMPAPFSTYFVLSLPMRNRHGILTYISRTKITMWTLKCVTLEQCGVWTSGALARNTFYDRFWGVLCTIENAWGSCMRLGDISGSPFGRGHPHGIPRELEITWDVPNPSLWNISITRVMPLWEFKC